MLDKSSSVKRDITNEMTFGNVGPNSSPLQDEFVIS
jgi:hypothetical protein